MRRLQSALEAEEGIKASREDIASALIYGATVPQAAGMLTAFIRHAAESAERDQGGPEQP
jgi:hypothetical protein